MKLIYLTFLTLSLVILGNAQSTEEGSSPSDETSPADVTSEEGPTENPDSPSSPSGEEGGSTSESAEGDSTTEKTDGQDQKNQDSKEEKTPDAGAGATAEKGSYAATYDEIGKILDSVDFKSIEDLHLQRMLENNYQARLRNPIRSQTGQIADFSAIQSCFGKLGDEVKKFIDDAKKGFETCKTGGGDSSRCTDEQENKFADGVIGVTTTLQGCISSNRKD